MALFSPRPVLLFDVLCELPVVCCVFIVAYCVLFKVCRVCVPFVTI